jgi:hypothetical protein
MFLAMKALSPEALHEELLAVLGPEAVGYWTVTKWLRHPSFPAIVDALAKFACIPTCTVDRH